MQFICITLLRPSSLSGAGYHRPGAGERGMSKGAPQMQVGHRVSGHSDLILMVLLQDMLVVLDERGKEATSHSLADLIAKVTSSLQPTEDA